MGVTSGAAWRRANEVTLPSGNVAMLRRPDVVSLILNDGSVPEVFVNLVMRGLTGDEPEDEETSFTLDDLGEFTQILDAVTRACFVMPCIVDKPEAEMNEDEIGIQHVSFNDKTFIFQWALTGGQGAAAEKFLEEQAARLDALSAGADVSEQPGGNSGD